MELETEEEVALEAKFPLQDCFRRRGLAPVQASPGRHVQVNGQVGILRRSFSPGDPPLIDENRIDPPIGPAEIENHRGLGVAEFLLALGILDARAGLLGSEKLMAEQFDPYVFLRSAYLERRWNLQHDGNPPVEEIDYDALLAE